MLKWLNKDLADVGKVGITFGAMDLLHGGHIAMLAEAKRKCDYLVVGLQNDPSGDRDFKNAPVQSLFERQLQLSAVRYVDDIIVYNKEEEIVDILLTLPIKVRIIGEDYLNQPFTGKSYVNRKVLKWFITVDSILFLLVNFVSEYILVTKKKLN